jgi:hypothetical protein
VSQRIMLPVAPVLARRGIYIRVNCGCSSADRTPENLI